MNREITKMQYKDVISVYFAVVKGDDEFSESSPNYSIWNRKVKDQETGVILQDYDVLKRYNNKAHLYPEWGKIVCISVAYILDDKIALKSFTGDEKTILNEFTSLIASSGRKLLTHNHSFILPYIRKRFVITNNGKADLYPITYSDSGKKPWETGDFCIDIMDVWRGNGMLSSSLDEIMMCSGVEQKEEQVTNFNDLYYKEHDIDTIIKKCESCVTDIINVVRVWKGDVILPSFHKVTKTPIVKKDDEETKIKNKAKENKGVKELTEEEIKEQIEIQSNKTFSQPEQPFVFENATPLEVPTDRLGSILSQIMDENIIENDDVEALKEKLTGFSDKEIKLARDLIVGFYSLPMAKVAVNKERANKVDDIFLKITKK